MVSVVTATLHIRDQAIHCSGCGERIAKVLGRLRGVRNVQTYPETQTVTVLLDLSSTSLREVRDLLAKTGYPSEETGPGG